jgi:hypothetical protein
MGLPIAFTMRLQSGNGEGGVVFGVSEVAFMGKQRIYWELESKH